MQPQAPPSRSRVGSGSGARGTDAEGSQESASDAESRERRSPQGPPSTASDREETLRSWDASAASGASGAASGPASEGEAEYDAGDDAESTTAASSSSSSSSSARDDWLQGLLSGMERYNPAHIAPLEALVARQSDGEEPYCAEANLALLALYQLNPRRFDPQRARQVLLLALGHLPLPDFVLCKCLLQGGRMERAPLADIVALAELLETCAFAEFWRRVGEQPDLVAGVRGLHAAVRDFVAHVVGSAYQRLSLGRLNALLGGLPEDELQDWLRERHWTTEAKGEEEPVVFVGEQEQVVKNRRIVERVELDTIERLLARMAD